MNVISFSQTEYTIPDDFINKSNSLVKDNWVIINYLEIYEIIEN